MINPPRNKLEKAALEFHLDNPIVWELFVRFTEDVIVRGFINYSVNAIFERIRWETDIVMAGVHGDFKLNNNHRAYYARWYSEQFPERENFFRIRAVNMDAQWELDDD